MQPVKITIITQFYPPDYAPTGQLISELAVAIAREGHSIQVFTGQPGYAYNQLDAPVEEFFDQVFVKRSRSSRLLSKRIRGKLLNGIIFFLRSTVKMRRRMSRGSHLLITSAPPFLPLVGWLYHKLFGHSYTCLIYDIYPDAAIKLGVISEANWIAKFWQYANHKIWRRAKSLIVLSESMKTIILAKDASLKDKIYVIPSWANPEEIKPVPKADNWFIKQNNWEDYFIVMHSGNLGRCHDEKTLIDCATILKDHPRIRFVFVGDGDGKKKVEAEVLSGNLPNAILLPYQPREHLSYSLSSADLSLVTIKSDMEGIVTPSKLYGVLASGRAIAAICPQNSYLRDLIDQGKCGAYFSNGDAAGLAEYICKLADNPSLQQTLEINSRLYFEQNFTIGQVLPLYLSALGLH
ncbi:glycosyltransferase [Synechococcus sp. PCC 7502]|uniref:glycosyltransferase family 4 protein n=1 Tax=Synechococcus sp. PCC 7502 TaxID=1173263 RepID=UPI00029F8FE8|nr:glycosyltransferase family 4 protein [Synechococcus sp. PCC 7502]AFY72672.1 glycosyltransferase [Synechococcus sp. PCC 7502]